MFNLLMKLRAKFISKYQIRSITGIVSGYYGINCVYTFIFGSFFLANGVYQLEIGQHHVVSFLIVAINILMSVLGICYYIITFTNKLQRLEILFDSISIGILIANFTLLMFGIKDKADPFSLILVGVFLLIFKMKAYINVGNTESN